MIGSIVNAMEPLVVEAEMGVEATSREWHSRDTEERLDAPL